MAQPHFIIAGERRSGTTSLARWLSAHPQIYLHPRLDMAYFIDDIVQHRKDLCRGPVNPQAWHEHHSCEDYAAQFAGAGNARAVGEKSADYFFWEHAHARINACCPEVKLVITLRDPVERAWSHYLGEVGKGRETLSFEEAIEAEPERIRASDYGKDHLSYVTRGFYDRSLNTLFKTFDRRQVYVLSLQAMKDRPRETLAPLFRFLGVDDAPDLRPPRLSQNRNWTTFPAEFVRRHAALRYAEAAWVWAFRKLFRYTISDHYRRTQIQVRFESLFRKTKKDVSMNEDTRNRLRDRYAPHMIETENMVGFNPARPDGEYA